MWRSLSEEDKNKCNSLKWFNIFVADERGILFGIATCKCKVKTISHNWNFLNNFNYEKKGSKNWMCFFMNVRQERVMMISWLVNAKNICEKSYKRKSVHKKYESKYRTIIQKYCEVWKYFFHRSIGRILKNRISFPVQNVD